MKGLKGMRKCRAHVKDNLLKTAAHWTKTYRMEVNRIDCIYVIVISMALKGKVLGLLSFINVLNSYSSFDWTNLHDTHRHQQQKSTTDLPHTTSSSLRWWYWKHMWMSQYVEVDLQESLPFLEKLQHIEFDISMEIESAWTLSVSAQWHVRPL